MKYTDFKQDKVDNPKIPIRHWPLSERPRERLIEQGPQGLSTAELIAIIIRTGSKKASAIDLAVSVLKKFSTLRGIESASIRELASIKGLGKAKSAMIKASLELGKRLMSEPALEEIICDNPEAVFELVKSRLKFKNQECFLCLCLDSKNRLIAHKELYVGTMTKSYIHPRDVFAYAIKQFAVGIIIVHNHPTGNVNPSHEDIEATRRLRDAGEVVGISLLDHIIIAADTFCSLKRQGVI